MEMHGAGSGQGFDHTSPTEMPARHPLRKNGFSRPWNLSQILAACTLVTFAGAFVTMILAACHNEDVQIIAIALYSACFVPVLALWFAAEMIDPASEGTCTVAAFKGETEMRYDREMGKKIPGLDHHCKWLNTGIGRRNYLIFFALIVLIFVLWLGQFLTGFIILVYAGATEDEDQSAASVRMGIGGYVSIFVHECVLGFFLAHVGQLILFHRMLQRTGQSTYGYMTAAAKAKSAKRKAERLAREKRAAEGGGSIGECSNNGSATIAVAPEHDEGKE